MDRIIFKDLAAWKEGAGRKPLILRGMRQCGKTWVLRELGRRLYGDTAYFNFEGNEALMERFEGDLDPRRIIAELGILRKKPIDPAATLVIFDEIQFCNRALTSLKYFCEDAPEYHVACAGSLLGLALSKPLSFPVGKVELLSLRPLNFYEFLLANGEESLCGYLENLGAGEKISALFTTKLEQYLRSFFISGGMPEAAAHWIEHRDIRGLEAIQQRILDSYELDFAKHAPGRDFPKLQAIWRAIPGQLAKENSKFIFSQAKAGSRSRDLEDALEWLIGAALVYKVAKIEKPSLPLAAYADQSFFKIYLADIGLLRKMSGLPAETLLGQDTGGPFKEFKGALTENYALCELVQAGGEVPFFWRSGNSAEVDFVIRHGGEIVPVEVKSGRNGRSKSLAEYLKRYAPRRAVKAGLNNFGRDQYGERQTVPLYMLWNIGNLLGESEGGRLN
jgi:predicted AAA+ superfamily ATPase